MRLVIFVNGLTGVGGHQVADRLSKLFPHAKLLDTDLFGILARSVVSYNGPDYYPLRARLRDVLEYIANDELRPDVEGQVTDTLVITGTYRNNPWGRICAELYHTAAVDRGARFVSVVLVCSVEEQLERAPTYNPDQLRQYSERGLVKFMDSGPLEARIRFMVDGEFELDVTNRDRDEVAEELHHDIYRLLLEQIRRVNGVDGGH